MAKFNGVKKEGKTEMYHPYSKNDPVVRKALYEAYSHKCAYCGDLIQPKNMQVDHILATNSPKEGDAEFIQYIDELTQDGFELDSMENYYPTCAACNLTKNNRNFSVTNLRFFHSVAQRNISKVLSILNKYKDQQISFDEFDPEYDYWERIDFSVQKDISEAIAGYRLQPCHVCSCPRLPQVEEIKGRLDVVDYVIVEGEPGCGKSISVYQAAFDLSTMGYTVYRYINKNAAETVFVPQSIEKKHLIIIDDAQNLHQFSIEHILSQSRKQTKIIIAFTKLVNDERMYANPIRITNFDSVKTIAQDYKKRKQEILPIIQQFDKNVGDGILDTPYESRLKNAATKNTPWLLNYTLRGGWNTVNEQFQAVYYHNRCGLLSTIIALFQILKMDSAIDFGWLQTYIYKFDATITWTENDLDLLIKNKLVASSYDIRIVHIESAKSIIHCFFKVADEASKKLICSIVEDGFQNHYYTEQGLIWLQSVISLSTYDLETIAFSESLLDLVFSHLDNVQDGERRGFIVYFLERMFYLHREKNGRYYFKQNENTFAQWISSTTSKNAYAYSQLINALNNERNDSLSIFVSKIDIDYLLHGFANSSVNDLYVWSKLLNRIACAYNDEERAAFGELLRESLSTKSRSVTSENVGEFFSSSTELYYLNPDLIIDLLTNNIDQFRNYCSLKPKEAIDVVGYTFLSYICGVPFLSYHKPTRQQRDFSKKFVNALPVIPISNYISHSLPRDWQGIYQFGCLLYRENKKRYSKIVQALDYSVLSESSSKLWKRTDRDLHLLFSFIAYGDYACAQKFFDLNKQKIDELGVVFIEALPEQAIKLYNNGVKFRLFENCWNGRSLHALMALRNVSIDDYNEILNSEVSQLVSKINKFCILDFEKDDNSLYEVLTFVKDTCSDSFSKVVPLLDFETMKQRKLSILKDYRYNRTIKKQLDAMIDLLIGYADENSVSKLQTLKEIKKDNS